MRQRLTRLRRALTRLCQLMARVRRWVADVGALALRLAAWRAARYDFPVAPSTRTAVPRLPSPRPANNPRDTENYLKWKEN